MGADENAQLATGANPGTESRLTEWAPTPRTSLGTLRFSWTNVRMSLERNRKLLPRQCTLGCFHQSHTPHTKPTSSSLDENKPLHNPERWITSQTSSW